MTPRLLPLVLLLTPACSQPRADYHEPRAACAVRDPLRSVFFGDLHVHTSFSFDAYGFDVRTTPAQAYAFARGQSLALPPLNQGGQGTRVVKIDRPLDFAAVTDHSEFLGEVESCTVPGAAGYDSPGCAAYRRGGNGAVATVGLRLSQVPPERPGLCGASSGAEGANPDDPCAALAGSVWRRVQQAANDAYDRSPACAFTTFVGYEYSASPNLSTLHRNVLFRSDRVPAPTTTFEQPTPEGLWRELDQTCRQDPGGCDVLAIPHNPNESNGTQFLVPPAATPPSPEQQAAAALRGSMEPLLEIYQHKGDSECQNGLSGALGEPDELCDFEKQERTPQRDCGEGTGSGGTSRNGCYSSRDFARGVLLAGLREEARLGTNPFPVGFIASTDTHNGTPGLVGEATFPGHRGLDDDTPQKRLGRGELTPGGVAFSAGGLAAIWAEENTREALFDALRRREVYGTTGPRITLRFFGGADLPAGLCNDAELTRKAYAAGVPMGGRIQLAGAQKNPPRFVVAALRDAQAGGAKLRLLQIVKGWLDSEGRARTQVFDLSGRRDRGPGVDLATCRPLGTEAERGADALCAELVDPDPAILAPGARAFYYARVLEEPTCRWSTYECNALPPAGRPPSCSDPAIPPLIQERAWSSPIWLGP